MGKLIFRPAPCRSAKRMRDVSMVSPPPTASEIARSQGRCQIQAAPMPTSARPMIAARKPSIKGTSWAASPRTARRRPCRPRLAPHTAPAAPNAIKGTARYNRHERYTSVSITTRPPSYRVLRTSGHSPYSYCACPTAYRQLPAR